MRGLRKGQQCAIGRHQRSVETPGSRRDDPVHGVGQRRSRNLTGVHGDRRREFGKTSIQARLQKNVHLISLKGQAMPLLATDEWLTDARMTTGRGPTLLFFWAHWCADCKLFAKTLTAVQREFGHRGLQVVAPTQRYGYIGARDHVAPAEEARHIREIQREFYPTLTGIPIPLSAKNFSAYGVSTTPTLVLVDRAGRVQRYQPGGMAASELRQAIAALF